MQKKWTKVFVLVLVCLVATVLASCAFGNQHGTNMKSVGELLQDNGYESSDTSWLKLLTDEQQTAIKDAYETDKSAGYQGSQDDWMTERLHCYANQNNEAVLVMPDGTEFIVSPNEYFFGESDGASSESDSTGDFADAKNGLASPKEEWQPLLTSEQNAAIDISYEAGVASGYKGTRDEWLSNEVSAHYNRSGDIVVSMPGGEDFAVVKNKDDSSSSKPDEQATKNVGKGVAASNAAAGTTIADKGVDKKYYLDEDGQLVTGWHDIDNGQGQVNHYYFRPSGSMATGWATIDGEKYWFRPSGNMATGFADADDAYKRYFDESGHMLTGWQTIDGKTFYFRIPSGAMQTGAATIDGRAYEFTSSGTLKS